jgi:hypothetical protein
MTSELIAPVEEQIDQVQNLADVLQAAQTVDGDPVADLTRQQALYLAAAAYHHSRRSPTGARAQGERQPPDAGVELVPVEPTEAMVRAAVEAWDAHDYDGPEDEFTAIYRAMIAAAPALSAPVSEPSDADLDPSAPKAGPALKAFVAKGRRLLEPSDAVRGEKPSEPGGFVGDIFFGDPRNSTRGTHRWSGDRWEALPSDAEVLTELLAEARSERDVLRTQLDRAKKALREVLLSSDPAAVDCAREALETLQ